MKVLNYINNRNYKLTLEKLIIGVEEPIFIKGVGEILAKADSGNSAFNVLHGEDFYTQGDVLVFTTYDEEDNPHRVSKKVQGTVDINIGAGHTEHRPIVLLDVKFAGDEYINVPFTIGNRSTSKNKVLLGKEFLTKELDVLIDVSTNNISDKNIEVDLPVTEGTMPAEQGGNNVIDSRIKANPSGATTKVGKGLRTAWGAAKGAYDMFRTFSKTGQTIENGIEEVKNNWEKMMNYINDYQKTDKELIFKFINNEFQLRNQRLDGVFDNPQVIKILDYLGNDYSGNNNLEEEKQVAEAVETEETVKQAEASDDNIQNNKAVFNKARKAINNELKTIIYLIIYKGDDVKQVKQILSDNYQNFDNNFKQLIASANLSVENPETVKICNNIIDNLYTNGISAAVVACSGTGDRRSVTQLTSIFKYLESSEGDNQDVQETKNDTEENIEDIDLETENIFGDKLTTIDVEYENVDLQMMREFIQNKGLSPNLLTSYTVFAFTNKIAAYEHNANDNNIRKNVILYYFVYSNLKPNSVKIAKEFKNAEELIRKLVGVFDIDSISEAAKDYISQFNATIKENGILAACFGSLEDRRGIFLGANTAQAAAKNPKLIADIKEPTQEKTEISNATKKDKAPSKVNDKKKSDKRRAEWKKVLKSLPKNYTEYSEKQRNQLYSAINRLTKGDNNYGMPVPEGFTSSKKIDNKIIFVSSINNGKTGVIRRKNNNIIYEYHVIQRAGKKYISLAKYKKLESADNKKIEVKDKNKQVEMQPKSIKKQEKTTKKPVEPKQKEQKKVEEPKKVIAPADNEFPEMQERPKNSISASFRRGRKFY